MVAEEERAWRSRHSRAQLPRTIEFGRDQSLADERRKVSPGEWSRATDYDQSPRPKSVHPSVPREERRARERSSFSFLFDIVVVRRKQGATQRINA